MIGDISPPVRTLHRANSISTSSEATYRFFGTYRFLLALLVVIHHFHPFMPVWLHQAIFPINFGEIAVAVFFVISGFIIAEANCTFYKDRPGAFLVNRIIRIVPPFLAALVLSILIHAFLWYNGAPITFDNDLKISPVHPQLVINNLLSVFPVLYSISGTPGKNWYEFIPFVWTLRVEITFYILAFAAYYIAGPLSRRYGDVVRHYGIALIFIGGFALFGMYLALGKPRILVNIPFFLLGAATYYMLAKKQWMLYALILLCAIASVLAYLYLPARTNPDVGTLRLVAFISLMLLPMAISGMAVASKPLRLLDAKLGELSYPLYLNHFVVGVYIHTLTAERSLETLAIAVAVSILLSTLMNKVVEKPLKTVRTRIRGAVLA